MNITFQFPQYTMERKTATIDKESAEKLSNGMMTDEDKANLICAHLTEEELKWLPNGVEGLMNALDVNYAWVHLEKK